MNILNTLVSFEKYTKEEAIFILWKMLKQLLKCLIMKMKMKLKIILDI